MKKTTMIKMLTRGNSKLHKSIFGFSLTPVKSCINCSKCKDTCYAIQSYKQYPNVKIAWDRNFEMAKDGSFVEHVVAQLSKARSVEVVRIHVAGDFFNQNYINQWNKIVKMFPALKFYAYTKTIGMLDYKEILKNENMNIINSIASDGGVNYGDADRIDALVKLGYKVCPATVKSNGKVVCGKDCKICITEDKVAFHQH